MRTKFIIPAAITAAALALAGCSGADDAVSDVSDHVKTGKLDRHQKAVVTAWYDAASADEKTRMEKLSPAEVLDAVNGLTLLCVFREDRIAEELARQTAQFDAAGAARLADAIDDHLCERPKTPKQGKTPKPGASTPTVGTPSTTAKPPLDTNPSHDLAKPTSRRDREEITLRAPGPVKKPASRH